MCESFGWIKNRNDHQANLRLFDFERGSDLFSKLCMAWTACQDVEKEGGRRSLEHKKRKRERYLIMLLSEAKGVLIDLHQAKHWLK
jgi:hypothetical protein